MCIRDRSAGGYNFILNSSGEIEYGRPDTALKKLATVDNPTIQNGFYQFVQNTKPTQRAAGVPLVAGDRWFNTSNGIWWFWNETYWLSNQLFVVQGAVVSQSFSNSFVDSRGEAIVFSDFNSIFVERAQVVWEYTSYSESNYWQFSVMTDRGNIISPLVDYFMLPFTTTSGAGSYELAVNTAYTFTSDYPWGIRLWAIKVGSPGNVTFAEGYRYRLISP